VIRIFVFKVFLFQSNDSFNFFLKSNSITKLRYF